MRGHKKPITGAGLTSRSVRGLNGLCPSAQCRPDNGEAQHHTDPSLGFGHRRTNVGSHRKVYVVDSDIESGRPPLNAQSCCAGQVRKTEGAVTIQVSNADLPT